MSGRIEKTVFISYRRTNFWTALAVYQSLRIEGYDAFIDYQNIRSGDFEKILIDNIKARAHFLVVLSPSTLERCINPDDWLRREIETALDEKRNIVPLTLDGFDFGNPEVVNVLVGKLSSLRYCNALRLLPDYFQEAMVRLRNEYLNIALKDVYIHPLSAETKDFTDLIIAKP